MNRWSQEGQGTQGHGRKDHTTNVGETSIGCGRQGRNRTNGPIEDEGTSWSKLGGMGMISGWMEVGTQLGIGVKLTIGFPLNVWQHFGNREPTWFTMPSST